jgi:phosphoribosylformylglycinamidine cyclo-ligase
MDTIRPVSKPRRPLSYQDAGVDIDRGNRFIEEIKESVATTRRPGVLSSLGGFGGLFDLGAVGLKNPILVAGTDGVGTKLRLANMLAKHDTIGIDLVAMCVNDVVVQGAQPLFFLDYYATSKLEISVAAQVVAGIAAGCRESGAALLGGETAEMPGMYNAGDYDLAGFCVGAVEAGNVIDGTATRPGDLILGLASSGVHSNGFSLVHKLLEESNIDLGSDLDSGTLGELLLAPTRIYVRSILELVQATPVHALAHITGGGLLENIPRVLPAGTGAVLDLSTWVRSELFQWLRAQGNIETTEMLRTFNCGIGMAVVIPEDSLALAQEILIKAGENCQVIGQIVTIQNDEDAVQIEGQL